ncbi:MAG TPA: PqqD family protein [Acidimicrobiales bacterium]
MAEHGVESESLSMAGTNGSHSPMPPVSVSIAKKPEDIDASFAPNPRESSVSYRFDDEVLVVDDRTGRIHVLNSIAAIVWECFDGTVTLGELAQELAEVFEAPVEVVIADILGMTRQLGELGLLAGVALFVPGPPPAPGVREVGESIGVLQVTTSSGDLVTVPRPESKGTLLINWSPSCGYCSKIVGDLEQCRPGLVERGIDLVLLTVGSDEDNRRVLDPAGLSDAAFYRKHAEDGDHPGSANPFGSLGTPVAYLLGVDGVIEHPAALGADQVPNLAREAAGLQPEPTEVTSQPDADQGGVEHVHAQRPVLPAAGGMCGPSPHTGGKAPRQWASTLGFDIGDYRVGVRADSIRTEELLARVFGAYLVQDGPPAAANFSVVLGGADSGDAKALSLLLAADATVLRSRSSRRVVRALQARLSGLLDRPDTDGLVRTVAVAALAGDRAFLLPPAAIRGMEYLQPRLARLGVRLSDAPGALVDPATGELVIPEPAIEVAHDVLEELGEVPSSRSELLPMEPGRYRLGAWGFECDQSAENERSSRAGAIAALLPAVEGSPDQLGKVIEHLERIVQQVRVIPLNSASERELMQSIEKQLPSIRNESE